MKTRNEVFTLCPKALSNPVVPKIKVDTKFLQMNRVTSSEWKEVKQLQGNLGVQYLKLRYGSPDTYMLLAYVGGELSHVEWIVPYRKIKSRYSFVSKDSYSIISCLTSQKYRGLGIYPGQIQKVIQSGISAPMFWIWTMSTNIASLKGICKSGCVKVGEFLQKKWFWGIISQVEYFPETSEKK
jgi:hypothetical protein